MKGLPLSFGHLCDTGELTLPKAVSLSAYAHKTGRPVVFLGCYRGEDGSETIELRLDVEVPQYPVVDIREEERVAITLSNGDLRYPEILALREDFPVGLIHTNRRESERPVSLCLFEEPYDEVKRHLSAHDLVEHVRRWLALAARGELHAEDQAIERFIDVAGTLVLPSVSDSSGSGPIALAARSSEHHLVLIASPHLPANHPERFYYPVFVSLKCSENSRISRTPKSLSQLSDLLGDLASEPLPTILRKKIWDWYDCMSPKTPSVPSGVVVRNERERERQYAYSQEEQRMARFFGGRLIIIIKAPRVRTAGSEVEQIDHYGFLVLGTLEEIAFRIDALARIDDKLQKATVLLNPRTGDNVQVLPLRIVSPFDASQARACSGEPAFNGRIALIGAGALGSQLIFSLIRGGWGRWSVIDHDVLLPHNLARHGLFQEAVGHPKAIGLQVAGNGLLANESLIEAIVADVQVDGSNKDEALRRADLVVDCSASVSVARFLGASPDFPRCVSFFVNPVGTDLVVLAEDLGRKNRLDTLEMCYHRALATQDALDGHLTPAGKVRYGGSCRDISFILPPHLFGLHASQAAECLKRLTSSPNPAISIWRHDSESMETRRIVIEPRPYQVATAGEWKLLIDPDVFRELQVWRGSKLPNETGGILLGAIDISRRHVYVVMSLAAPPDSEEWPTSYIRGCHGLKSRCDEIAVRTQHEIVYVGEWHSHPDGASTQLSQLDREFLSWLENEIGKTGRPPVVFIVGRDDISIYCDGHRFIQASHPVLATG